MFLLKSGIGSLYVICVMAAYDPHPTFDRYMQYYIQTKELEEKDFPGGSLWGCSEPNVHLQDPDMSTSRLVLLTAAGDAIITRSWVFSLFLNVAVSIRKEEAELLWAIKEASDRLSVYKDRIWIDEGVRLDVKDEVVIQNCQDVPEGAWGTIRHKGNLRGSSRGIWFGVELAREYRGYGTSTGRFMKVDYFKCERDCGMFVSLFKVRARRRRDSVSDTSVIPKLSEVNLRPGERIVWWDGKAQHGTVRWIGYLPQSSNDTIMAGVEFDDAIGKGNGRYKGEQLFQARRGHASLVPIVGLMRESDVASHETAATVELKDSGSKSDIILKPRGLSKQDDSTTTLKNEDDVKGKTVVSTSSGASDLLPQSPVKSLQDIGLPDILSAHYHQKTLSSDDDEMTFDNNIKEDKAGRSANEETTQDPRVGSKVQVLDNPTRYGIIRWIGDLNPGVADSSGTRLVAGIEMEDSDPGCYTDGTYLGEVRFPCPPHRALFIGLDHCHPDQRDSEAKESDHR